MVGILAGLGLFTPFADAPPCKLLNQTNINNATTEANEQSFWKENFVIIPALILTVIFIILNALLLIFVKERTGLLTSNLFSVFVKAFLFILFIILKIC